MHGIERREQWNGRRRLRAQQIVSPQPHQVADHDAVRIGEHGLATEEGIDLDVTAECGVVDVAFAQQRDGLDLFEGPNVDGKLAGLLADLELGAANPRRDQPTPNRYRSILDSWSIGQ